MRVGFYVKDCWPLPWAVACQNSGAEVLLYHKDQKRYMGRGIVPVTYNLNQFMQWCRDGNAIVVFDNTGSGELAEEWRAKGMRVILGGKFQDRLEKDRMFGFEIAERAGIKLPPYVQFESFRECLAWAQSQAISEDLFFKSDRYVDADTTHKCKGTEDLAAYLEGLISRVGPSGQCIVQKKIDGVDISTARWWSGNEFVGPTFYTNEYKPLMNGNVGPSTGCSLNVCWAMDHPTLLDHAAGWQNLSPIFREHKAAPGIYDVNCLLTEAGDAYFLEWTPRLGYDSEMTLQALYPNLPQFLADVLADHEPAVDTKSLVYAARVAVPPYPWEHAKPDLEKGPRGLRFAGLPKGSFVPYDVMMQDGHLCVSDGEGLVGLVSSTGRSLKTAHERVMEAVKEVDLPGLMYRTDGLETIEKDNVKLRKAGLTLHPGLS